MAIAWELVCGESAVRKCGALAVGPRRDDLDRGAPTAIGCDAGTSPAIVALTEDLEVVSPGADPPSVAELARRRRGRRGDQPADRPVIARSRVVGEAAARGGALARTLLCRAAQGPPAGRGGAADLRPLLRLGGPRGESVSTP